MPKTNELPDSEEWINIYALTAPVGNSPARQSRYRDMGKKKRG